MLDHFKGEVCVRDVKVEFGDLELTISLREAEEWNAAGLAEWLPRRNRMRFTARRDPKPVLRGLSAVAGEAAAAILDRQLRQLFIRSQFLKREHSSAN